MSKKKFYSGRFSKPYAVEKGDQPRIKAIIELAGKNNMVLDIGCYDGTISKMIQKNENKVYGIDLSNEGVYLATKRGIQALLADAEKGLPFQDKCFDIVVVAEVIEHVFDTNRFLKEVNRILKTNGQLILTTPNLASLGRRMRLLFGMNPLIETMLGNGASGHIRYFVKDTLINLLNANEFEIDVFKSDLVNFNNKGTLFSTKLARIFPTWGRTLIVRATPRSSTG